VVDIACIADDIWDIRQNGLTWDNGLALAADVGGLLLPGLTGGGMLVRAAAHADDVADAARTAAQGGEAVAGAGAPRYIGPERQLTVKPYPTVDDPRTGKPIPFPEGNLVPVDRSQRVPWSSQAR